MFWLFLNAIASCSLLIASRFIFFIFASAPWAKFEMAWCYIHLIYIGMMLI